MLDYKLLEALAAVVAEGGFERAAGRLHLTQSAVSQRIKQLEEQAGQVLLVRAMPPRPTAAGKHVLQHYHQVLRLEHELSRRLTPSVEKEYVPLTVALNADSLAAWFLQVAVPFMEQERILPDLRVDDQEQTHRMLKDGDVAGCISVLDTPVQGCRMEYLGRMDYRMAATPGFAARWFPKGLTEEAVCTAPSLSFNRKDNLNNAMFKHILGFLPRDIPTCYLPSSEQFMDFIVSGTVYGMLTVLESEALIRSGRLTDLAPEHRVSVHLYWHCWNIGSDLLNRFTAALVSGARQLLEQD